MTNLRKKLLFISRHAPYGSSLAKEALDAVLAAAAYDQDISLLFMDDGVFQLLNNQETKSIHQKNFAMMLSALSYYDIDKIYVHQESLQARQILLSELLLTNIRCVDNKTATALFAEQDHLLSF
jgi:tRNA 2-thiouridine synthesizing protein C